MLVGTVVSSAGGAAALATPLLAREFVDRLGSGRPILGLSALLCGIVLAGAVVAGAGRYLIDRTAEEIVRDVRSGLVTRLLRLRVGALNTTPPGDLISRVTADTTLLRHATTNDLVDLVLGTVVLVGMAGFMAYLDPVLFGVVAAVMLLVGGATALVMPRLGAANRRAQDALGDIGGQLERALGALRTIKANGAERREAEVMHHSVDTARDEGITAARWSAVAGSASGLVVQLSFLAVFGVGGARVADGSLPVSSLIAFLMYLFYLYSPINQLVQGVSGLQAGMAAVRRIEEVEALSTEPDDRVPPAGAGRGAQAVDVVPHAAVGGYPGGRPSGEVAVAFRAVHFRYAPDGPDILSGVDFEVPAGGMTALVGPSGAGKSTVFALLERFHEADSGVVEFAGRNVRDLPIPRLRADLGYVEQDAPVLSGTLRENLLFAAPDASAAQLAEAMEQTRLTDLVRRLPDGLDTRVGHRGMNLSGGERQRIAIARALLRRPRVLLLDEATSALDGLNELSLRDAIAEVARVSTVLIIAHRLSTVTMARQILLLDGGRIRARGTHAELIDSDDLYRTLAMTQLLDAQSGADRRTATAS
ncbi:ABC transporter ATP-binding protein [Micromonospora rubida]|uniref:ABC transporter ATP-binding protein n=1 Tax=Micromonospora rubida TaxID=2697657 RepID=UPI00191C6F10|nr:ABC transporter ATP-binding protein [Micromonospora rubida]